MPALLIDRLPKVATPLIASAVVVPLNVPALGFVPMANVTNDVFVVTTLPFASSMATVTAGVIGVLIGAVVGCCTNATCVAVPGLTLKGLLVVIVREPSAAASV